MSMNKPIRGEAMADREQEREAFERWFSSQADNRGQRPNRAQGDGYHTYSTQRMWEAWMARASLGANASEGDPQ